MSLAATRPVVVALVLLGTAAIARAGFPAPAPPVAQRVALADAVVVGNVVKVEAAPVEAFPLLRVRGGRKVLFKMAQVRVDRVLRGRGVAEVVRVGVGPGPAMPELTEGQAGCFFLHRHPDGPFHVLSAGSDFIDSRRQDYGTALSLAARCARLLEGPDEGLRSRDGEDRLLTAALLVFQYRTARYVYRGAPRTEPIDAGLSRRILAVLGEGPLAEKAARGPTGRLTVFLRLGLTGEDGWKPPHDLPGIAAAAATWLRENGATYRIRRYVPEEPMPVDEEPRPTPAEAQPRGGSTLRALEAAVRRRPWAWVAGVAGCFLAVTGFLVYRQVWAEMHYRRAEEALARSLRVPGPAPVAEARDHLARCLEVWPNSGRVHFLMARAARLAGDADGAARSLRRAEQAGWVKEAIDLEKTLAAVQQGDLERAEPVLDSFVRRDHPDKLFILEALVQGCRRTYQLPRALAYLDAWLSAQPDSVRALVWRGETLLLAGRGRDALADYRKAVEIDPDEDEARLKLAELSLAQHQHEDAVAQFTELLKRHPDQGEALLGLARCREEQGDTAEAVRLLDRLLAAQPEHAGALAERGKIALDAGRPAEAEQWLRHAAAGTPFERETLYHLYRCLTAAGHTREAEEYLACIRHIDADRKRLDEVKAALVKSPHDAALRCEMGRILLRNGQDKEGVRWLQSALREQPDYGAAREALEEHQRRLSLPSRPN
ncbi:MAG TPA: tetratricopeptide repeat protein [Gemmataceae bacterium]|nr:tetratricopeptide repeat protein [Gemmataceae bacterium]